MHFKCNCLRWLLLHSDIISYFKTKVFHQIIVSDQQVPIVTMYDIVTQDQFVFNKLYVFIQPRGEGLKLTLANIFTSLIYKNVHFLFYLYVLFVLLYSYLINQCFCALSQLTTRWQCVTKVVCTLFVSLRLKSGFKTFQQVAANPYVSRSLLKTIFLP